MRELYELGLGDELARIAVAPAAIAYYDTDGTLLFREPRGIDGGYGYPQYSVHRGRLQMLLLSAVAIASAPTLFTHWRRLTGFDEIGDRRQVHTDGRRLRRRRACRSRRHPFRRPRAACIQNPTR